MDVHDKLDEITALVENARAMPMSSSCMVNRAELLALLDELRALLPEELDLADRLLSDREQVVGEGRLEAEQIVAAAHEERMRLVSETEVYAQAQLEASRIVADAETEAEQMRSATDEYVDGKLATFEISLNKTLAAVQRGRDKLRGRHDVHDLGDDTGPFQRISSS
ncbi:MAG: hypothetical protein MUC45_06370 [Actinomycetia bacterium]|nr:hypothetical protein [Actinomycetes bacterium]